MTRLTSPVMLPDHRYDLPGTLITAAQIEDHKKKMVAPLMELGTARFPPARN